MAEQFFFFFSRFFLLFMRLRVLCTGHVGFFTLFPPAFPLPFEATMLVADLTLRSGMLFLDCRETC